MKAAVAKRVKDQQLTEALQIVCLLLLCYSVPEKDYNELVGQLGSDLKASAKALRALQGSNSKSEIVRLVPTINEAAKQEYIKNYEQIALRKYDVVKVKPKICQLVSMAQKQVLDTAEFPYVGPSPPPHRGLEFVASAKGHSEPAQRLIVYVAGGITRTEISAL